MEKKSFEFYLLSAFLVIFPFLVGGYYSFYQAFVGIALMVVLFVALLRNKELKIQIGLSSITIVVITLLYLVVKLWALDKSMSIYGFVRMLCVALFMLNIWQIEKDERKSLIYIIPYSAVIMSVFSFALGQIAGLRSRFFDEIGDLHGTFEYANAYAQFMLIALIVLILKPHKKSVVLGVDIACAIISAVGLYLSNSRAVQLIAVAMLVVIIYGFILTKLKSKKQRCIYFVGTVITCAAVIVVLFSLGIHTKIYNYITTDGSMVERYLYYKDALFYALKHPFGKGEYAFYYAQPEFQSAYYYAIDVHNDYLQMMVEIGIIPTLLFVVMIVYNLVSKEVGYVEKAVLLAMAIHCLIDYDLKFAVLWFVLVLCLKEEKEKLFSVNGALIPAVISIVIILFNGVLGLSSYYNYAGMHNKSNYYYKNTSSMLIQMQSTNDQQTGYELANDILKKNDSIFEANNVLSNIYAANQRYDEAVEQMELVLKKNPRDMKQYEKYIDLCAEAEEYYRANNSEDAKNMAEKIVAVPNTIAKIEANTPQIAKDYGRKQKFKINKEHKKIVSKYKKQLKNY